MALEQAVLNAGVDGATGILAFAAIHSAATSVSQVSNERLAVTWDPATGAVGSASNVPLDFTGTASGPATHLGLWSAVSAGTFLGAVALSGDQSFNAAGEYSVTSIALTGSDQTA